MSGLESARKANPLEETIAKIAAISESEPQRYQQIIVDLQRSERGENPKDLDAAVRDLSVETRHEVLMALTNPASLIRQEHIDKVKRKEQKTDPRVN